MSTLLDDIKRDDLDTFFDSEMGFAVVAIYSSVKDGLKEIEVVFNRENPSFNPETGEIDNEEPELYAKTIDIENIRHKDTFEIEGVTYEALEPRPENIKEGVTWLRLGKL